MWEALCLEVSRGSQANESTSGRDFLEEVVPKALAFTPWLPRQDWDSLLCPNRSLPAAPGLLLGEW